MYTLCIAAGLASFLCMLICYASFRREKEQPIGFILFIGFFGALAGAAVGGCIAASIGSQNSSVQEQTMASASLAAMRDDSGFSGTFILGSGNVQSGHSYLFYIKNQDGSLTPYELRADTLVHIIEDKNLKDAGSWTTTISKRVLNASPWLQDWALLDEDERIVRQEFHVPVGTVVQKFKVN